MEWDPVMQKDNAQLFLSEHGGPCAPKLRGTAAADYGFDLGWT